MGGTPLPFFKRKSPRDDYLIFLSPSFFPCLNLGPASGLPLNKVLCLSTKFTSFTSLAFCGSHCSYPSSRCLLSINLYISKLCVPSDIFSESSLNTDTRLIRTLWHVRLMSVLTSFHCTYLDSKQVFTRETHIGIFYTNFAIIFVSILNFSEIPH